MSERIEGVPIGTKLARIGHLKYGFDFGEHLLPNVDVFIVPDNVYGVIDLSTVPIPEGWEYDGETVKQWFRAVNTDSATEHVLTIQHGIDSSLGFHSRPELPCPWRIHVRPIKPKTRRVLVETRIHKICDRDNKRLDVWSTAEAESAAERHPDSYRIEERPCE